MSERGDTLPLFYVARIHGREQKEDRRVLQGQFLEGRTKETKINLTFNPSPFSPRQHQNHPPSLHFLHPSLFIYFIILKNKQNQQQQQAKAAIKQAGVGGWYFGVKIHVNNLFLGVGFLSFHASLYLILT